MMSPTEPNAVSSTHLLASVPKTYSPPKKSPHGSRFLSPGFMKRPAPAAAIRCHACASAVTFDSIVAGNHPKTVKIRVTILFRYYVIYLTHFLMNHIVPET